MKCEAKQICQFLSSQGKVLGCWLKILGSKLKILGVEAKTLGR